MPVASRWLSTARHNLPGLRRAALFALVVAGHLLLIWALLRLAPELPMRFAGGSGLTVVDLMPQAASESAESGEDSEAEAAEAAEDAPVPPAPPETPVAPPASDIWSKVIPLNREQMAAADIAKMPDRRAAAGATGQDAARGPAGGDAEGPGTGPNGEPLYNADWYRRPTRAELGFYLPAGAAPTGWGMIACQTAPDFRVENCQEIGQSPPGSGLARAVRLAAWQFRVLPPRIGGRPMVGAWVRIRIDYTVGGAEN